MEDERRRKRDLTPLSGEVHAPAEWVPPEPGDEKQRVKKEKRLPQTRGEMILAGIGRSLVILALLGGLTAVAALLIVLLSDVEPGRAFPLSFYLGGALIAGGGLLGATTGPRYWMPEGGRGIERVEREQAFNKSFVYGAFGVALIVVGVLLDSLL